MPIQALGYEAVAHGNGRWNGVALLSRVGLEDVTLGPDRPAAVRRGRRDPRRRGHVRRRAACGASTSPTAASPTTTTTRYKLDWFEALRGHRRRRSCAAAPERPLAVIGDFNVAPTDADVWDIAQFAGLAPT